MSKGKERIRQQESLEQANIISMEDYWATPPDRSGFPDESDPSCGKSSASFPAGLQGNPWVKVAIGFAAGIIFKKLIEKG